MQGGYLSEVHLVHLNVGSAMFKSGYLKAVWPFFLGAFLKSGRPRGPGKALKNAPSKIRPDCLQVPRVGQLAWCICRDAVSPCRCRRLCRLLFCFTHMGYHIALRKSKVRYPDV